MADNTPAPIGPSAVASRRRLLSPRQVYEAFGQPFSVPWLERKRREGGGPRFLKVPGGSTAKVYYDPSEVERWLAANTFASTAAAAAAETKAVAETREAA